MFVTATELKNNLGQYLEIAKTENVFITKNGKSIAKLTNPAEDKEEAMKSLFGIAKPGMPLEQIRGERLSRYENID